MHAPIHVRTDPLLIAKIRHNANAIMLISDKLIVIIIYSQLPYHFLEYNK